MSAPKEWATASRQDAIEAARNGQEPERFVCLDDGRVIGEAGEPIPGLHAQPMREEEREAG